MFKFNIVARYTPEGIPGAMNFLGGDGKNYVLFYRLSILGFGVSWTPVPLVDTFPS